MLIQTAQQVVDEIKDRHDLVVTKRFATKQLKALGFKYKKIKHISATGNTDRNLVMR